MPENKFTHLHVHSDYSLLTGLSRVEEIVAKVKADGMNAVALTDLGNMYGIIEFYQECIKQQIKPIIGVEVYLAPNGMSQKRANIDEERHSLVLLAKDDLGYKNLLQIVSASYLEGFYYKPRVDFNLLKKFSSGLIALSGSLQGEIPKAILKNFSTEKLDQTLDQYLNIFGIENFFIEIIRHPRIAEQEIVNSRLIDLAKRRGVGLVAAANSFYLNTEDDKAHDILLCIQNNRKVYEDNRFSMIGEDYSLLSQKEILKRFEDIPEAISNTVKIADMCNVTLEFGKNKLPAFALPDGYTYESYLRLQCYKGLMKRYGGNVNLETGEWDIPPETILITYKQNSYTKQNVVDRLEYELSVIEKTGYASYFLIVSDFIIWSKRNGILVGPGRGSAAGSMVAYLVEIVGIDPIKYDLLFERFLNPERVSMPDIDTDFADNRRGDVIKYVQDTYGNDHVSGIITFGTLGAKAVIRDVGRALGVEYGYCDRLSKLMPVFKSLSEALEEVVELNNEYNTNQDCKNIFENALKLEGAKRHASQHACGILITKDPLVEYVPVQKLANDDSDMLVAQYSLHPVEDLGLLKMDFLGLKNLTIIEMTLETIKKIHGIELDLEKLPFDDQKTFASLKKGETTGVFQFESGGMKKYMKQLKPTELEDLIAMGALYRPGPLDAGMVDEYIQRKNGLKEVTNIHPLLEPILRDTYGVIVYQEQVMRIARDMAGFTMGQADTLRKAVGKKIKELMDKQQDLLIKGMETNKVPKKIATEIWHQIETFARYGFNRSHAACYGVISYYTAYLKANYPSEYLASLLTSDLDDIDRLSVEIQECRAMGIEVLLPDVNESFTRFTVVAQSLKEGRPRIRFGLAGIKGVGDNISKTIIRIRKEGGEFTSLEDFLLRVNSKELNKKSLDSLIRSGALDRFGARQNMMQNIETILVFLKENQATNFKQADLFGNISGGLRPTLKLDHYPEIDKLTQLSWEKELLGFYLSEHPYTSFAQKLSDHVVSSKDFLSKKREGYVRVAGLLTQVKKIVTKKGDIMCFAQLEDEKGLLEVIVFPSVYAVSSEVWTDNNLVIVSGTVSDKDDVQKVICNEVKVLRKDQLDSLIRGMKPLEVTEKKSGDLIIFFKNMVRAQTIDQLAEILKGISGAKKVIMAVPLDEKKFRKIETNFTIDLDRSDIIEKIGQLEEVKFVKII